MKLLDGLNAQQIRAVTMADGPTVIVAGPGTGKTKTLTSRIAYLLQSGVPADEIVALTFTNKAAAEMRERLTDLIEKGDQINAQKDGQNKIPIIATFHALAPRILPATDKRIATDSERQAILTSIKKSLRLSGSIRDIGLQLSRAKSSLTPVDSAIEPTLMAYNAALAARGLQDYDDVLLELYSALHSAGPNRRFRHVLIDEFQDTNSVQYDIMRNLARTNSIFAIGDPLQSIYGFRGASAAIFERFVADFPEAQTIYLTTNYRSRPEIVRATNSLFPFATKLEAYQQEPGVARAMELLNEYREADWVVAEIERRIGGSTMLGGSAHHDADQGRTFRDFAVLYRTHAVAKTMQRALEASGLPYQVAGEGSPYEQPAVQKILRALQYICNDQDDITDAVIAGMSKAQAQYLLDPLRNFAGQLPALVDAIIETLAIPDDTPTLQQFRNTLLAHANTLPATYLAHVQSLREQAYYDPAAEAITLTTIHAAKGLEFSCVFVIACEEGILPHARDGKIHDAEEERRLMYVATSRAREELYLLHTRRRGGQPCELSSFIRDLPGGAIARMVDPDMVAQQQALKRRQLKRAQGTLF